MAGGWPQLLCGDVGAKIAVSLSLGYILLIPGLQHLRPDPHHRHGPGVRSCRGLLQAGKGPRPD
jgi:hypothetical protein